MISSMLTLYKSHLCITAIFLYLFYRPCRFNCTLFLVGLEAECPECNVVEELDVSLSRLEGTLLFHLGGLE